jgi:hypothetical protein
VRKSKNAKYAEAYKIMRRKVKVNIAVRSGTDQGGFKSLHILPTAACVVEGK